MKFLNLLSILLFTTSCVMSAGAGVNTLTPTIPFLFLNPTNTPQVFSVVPSDSLDGVDMSNNIAAENSPVNPEFIVKYYVINTEQQFIGYNLYIRSTQPSLAEVQQGSDVYIENGVQPSFPHTTLESSTDKTKLIRKRIQNRVPAPGLVPFQKCEIYTFTMRAMMNNGLLSNPSTMVRACASKYPKNCPVGSSCNPTNCTIASCGDSTCPVGTVCNPCLYPSKESSGCECPDGVSPTGCNL